jgi:nucleoside-diphosphate-sugar epimerase
VAADAEKLLIIGGSGFIGRNVVARLAQADGLNRRPLAATYCRDASFVDWAAQWPHVTPIRFDGTTGPGAFSDYAACLYMAGNANHTWALDHPADDLRMNAGALLNALADFRGRLVYLSSGAVYYGLAGQVSPATPVQPAFPYAISKYASELYVRQLAHVGRLTGFTIVRLYYAYGPYEPARRLIPTLIRRLAFQDEERFTLNGDGETLMAPLYVDDVAAALCAALDGPSLNRAVDLCPPRPLALRALVEQAAAALDRPLRLSQRPTAEEAIRFWSSGDEARRLFGPAQPVSLAEGIGRYARWLRENARQE